MDGRLPAWITCVCGFKQSSALLLSLLLLGFKPSSIITAVQCTLPALGFAHWHPFMPSTKILYSRNRQFHLFCIPFQRIFSVLSFTAFILGQSNKVVFGE